MTRTLTAAVETALEADEVRPAWLVEINFEGGQFLRLWSGTYDLSWDSKTWTPVGGAGTIAEITETDETRAQGIELTLSGVDSSELALVIGDVRPNLVTTVWLALFDASDALIVDPVEAFLGTTDKPRIEDNGETANVSLTVESRMIDLERRVEKRFNHQTQQELWPGDLGFEFALETAKGRTRFAGKPDPNGLPDWKPGDWRLD